MISVKVNATGLKALDKFSPDLGRMVRRAGPYLFERIKARARATQTSEDKQAAPLGKQAIATKKKLGARPVRDYRKTGQVLDNLAISFLSGNAKRGARLKVWFRGAHNDTIGRRLNIKTKSGALKRKTNQQTANLAALVDQSRRQLPESYPGKPYHAFVEPSARDLEWLNRELDKEIQRALRGLPLDPRQ